MDRGRPSYSRIFAIVWPASLSGVAAPLLGLVDTWAIGNSDRPIEIAAIALGALVLAFLYWGFAFLRFTAAGLSAQAAGAKDDEALATGLGRVLLLALAIAAAVLALQAPLADLAFAILDGGEETKMLARRYFGIRVWGAPAFLILFGVTGWLTGQGRAGAALAIAFLQNAINAGLDIWFVFELGWGAAGVAYGTLIAEYAGAAAALAIAWRQLRGAPAAWAGLRWRRLADMYELRKMIGVNRDIFLRTIAIVFAFSWFASQGARQGDLVLAGNQILLQFFLVAAFALDGSAIAAESLVGRAVGARSWARFVLALRRTGIVIFGIALIAMAIYALIGAAMVGLLTDDPELRAQALRYLPWAVATPILTAGAFHLDGVFVGALGVRALRNSMALSLVGYLALWAALQPFGNHGLWAAFMGFFLLRWLTLGLHLSGLRRLFAAPSR